METLFQKQWDNVSTLISELFFLKNSIWFLPSQYRGATFIVFEEEKMNKKRTKKHNKYDQ